MNFQLHGANYEEVYRDYQIQMPEQVIDFSTNTNVLKFEVEECNLKELMSSYPDPNSSKLKSLLSKRINVKESNILITNGANEGIYLLASTFQNHNIGIIQPTYPEYEKAFNAYGSTIHHFFSLEEVKGVNAIIICNPNNPTGKYIPYSELQHWVEDFYKRNIMVIIDEAYIDFLSFDHTIQDINKYPNVIQLRSLTKTYHLSGLRIGYLLANTNMIQTLKKRQPCWSVNSVAQHYALEYLKTSEFILQTKQYYKSERKRVISQLKKYGFRVKDTSVNFYLLEVEDDMDIIKYLLKKGIVVRHTRNHVGLDGKYVRIAIRTIEENDKLISCLVYWLTEVKQTYI